MSTSNIKVLSSAVCLLCMILPSCRQKNTTHHLDLMRESALILRSEPGFRVALAHMTNDQLSIIVYQNDRDVISIEMNPNHMQLDVSTYTNYAVRLFYTDHGESEKRYIMYGPDLLPLRRVVTVNGKAVLSERLRCEGFRVGHNNSED